MFAFVSGFAGLPATRASSFNGAQFSQTHSPVRTARFSMAASKSVPFLPQPAKLDGTLPGDVGFDPLGFSDMFDLNFLREAEVKHGKLRETCWQPILSSTGLWPSLRSFSCSLLTSNSNTINLDTSRSHLYACHCWMGLPRSGVPPPERNVLRNKPSRRYW